MCRFFDFFLLNRRLLPFISAADHSSDHHRAFSQVLRGGSAVAQIPLCYRHYPAAYAPPAEFDVTFHHTQHVKKCVNNNGAAVASSWFFDNYPMPARIE
jgi:hypothetical protein